MKKTKKRHLTLTSETLRVLTKDQQPQEWLAKVNGGSKQCHSPNLGVCQGTK